MTTPASFRMSKAEFERLADFRYQLRCFLRLDEELVRDGGITPLQYLLLLQIKGFPGRDWATVGELAERLQAQPHGVVSLVSRCEAIGLVRRQRSSEDKRRVEVSLTPKGAQHLELLALLHRPGQSALQAALGEAATEVDSRQQAPDSYITGLTPPGRARSPGRSRGKMAVTFRAGEPSNEA